MFVFHVFSMIGKIHHYLEVQMIPPIVVYLPEHLVRIGQRGIK